MEQWLGQRIAVVMPTLQFPLQGILKHADYQGNLIVEVRVGKTSVLSRCFIPDRSYDMVYLVPDGAVFEWRDTDTKPRDNWAGVESN